MISKRFLQQMRKDLVSQKNLLLAKSKATEVDTDGDETDEIQANLLIEIANQLSTRDQLKIKLINEALMRIDGNTYGICEDCEEIIPQKRLLINPYFMTCISCAEDREMDQKQRKQN